MCRNTLYVAFCLRQRIFKFCHDLLECYPCHVYSTITEPVIDRWRLQKYENVPVAGNCTHTDPEAKRPESNIPSAAGDVPLVTVWLVPSLLAHLTMPLTATLTLPGLNANPEMFTSVVPEAGQSITWGDWGAWVIVPGATELTIPLPSYITPAVNLADAVTSLKPSRVPSLSPRTGAFTILVDPYES